MFPVLKRLLGRFDKLEQRIVDHPGSVTWSDSSPVRFEIMREQIKRGGNGPDKRFMPTMLRIISGMMKSLNPIDRNPPDPRRNIEKEELKELETYLLRLGASSLGYTIVPREFIFRNKGILHVNAIMLSMEMDKTAFEVTPSFACEHPYMDRRVLRNL